MYYQQRVASDQPLSFFEGAECGYLSVIDESQRNLTTWAASGHSSTVTTSFVKFIDSPMDSVATRILLSTVSSAGAASFTSPVFSKNVKDLHSKSRINVGAYVYVPSNKTSSITLKYQWDDGSWRTKAAEVPVPTISEPQWVFFSHSFDMTDSNPVDLHLADYQHRIGIDINFIGGGANGDGGDYDYIVNGVTVGQYAENVASSCLGKTGEYVVQSMVGGDATAKIYEYAGRLTAVVDGLPLHYGVQRSTLLNPWIPERPSISIRGAGFMGSGNSLGSATIEFWLKIAKSSPEPIRLVGPVGHSDGIYINNTTLVLSIGGTEAGYDLGQIDYPMLVHWVVSPLTSYIMVNGDVVIEIEGKPDTGYYGIDTEIGFYTDERISPVHISSIATYSYPTPSVLAKTRFVQGQGTIPYNLITDRYDGKSFSADFSTSNFATNISYPDNVRWSAGSSNNLVATDKLEFPKYSLPLGHESAHRGNSAMPATGVTFGSVTPLDASNDNTTGTTFGNSAVLGKVYTTVSSASSTNAITVPGNAPDSLFVRVVGKVHYSGPNKPKAKLVISGSTYTADFEPSDNGHTVDLVRPVPSGAGTITWGVTTGASTGFATFSGVYVQFYQDIKSFVLGEPSPSELQWNSLNFLYGDRVAAITANIKLSSASMCKVMSIRKRGTATALDIYASGGSIHYEYSDYTMTTVLKTFSITNNKEFTVGVSIDEFVEAVPEATQLFSQPAEVEVSVGDSGFDGQVYDVSFHNGWYNRKSGYTFSNGLANQNIRDPEKSQISTYTLVPVTEFGNFTLDVASRGYWQESIPLSLFSKEVADRYGEPTTRIDFIQGTVGKTHAAMDVAGEAPLTYFQLEQNYWGRAYSALAADYATYAQLAAETNTYYSPDDMDTQVWVAMQKLSSPVVDYTEKTEAQVFNKSAVYLDDDGVRYLVQDGNTIIVPYSYDIEKFVLVSYVVMKTDGVRSNPTRLKSYELASWASDANRWTAMASKEGNEVAPFVSNGSYYVYEYPNTFEVTKRGYNYLYKSNRSGYKPRPHDLYGYESGFVMKWYRSGSNVESQQLAGISMALHVSPSVKESTKAMSVVIGNDTLFDIHAVPIGGARYRIEARYQDGTPFGGVQWLVSGAKVAVPTLAADEWNLLQANIVDQIDTEKKTVSVKILGDGLSFDNITIHGRMAGVVRGVPVYRRWSDLIDQNWGYWTSLEWQRVYDVNTIVSVDIEGGRMAQDVTGSSPPVQFSASCEPQLQEIFAIRDVQWSTVEALSI